MRVFSLVRDRDPTGVSGTGVVAEGIVFDNGRVCLTWLRDPHGVCVYESSEAMLMVHGHDDATRLIWRRGRL